MQWLTFDKSGVDFAVGVFDIDGGEGGQGTLARGDGGELMKQDVTAERSKPKKLQRCVLGADMYRGGGCCTVCCTVCVCVCWEWPCSLAVLDVRMLGVAFYCVCLRVRVLYINEWTTKLQNITTYDP